MSQRRLGYAERQVCIPSASPGWDAGDPVTAAPPVGFDPAVAPLALVPLLRKPPPAANLRRNWILDFTVTGLTESLTTVSQEFVAAPGGADASQTGGSCGGVNV